MAAPTSPIELADAQLARVVCEASRVVLHLATAPAWRPGEGADTRPVPGHVSGVTLAFDEATLTLDAGCTPGECTGAVHEAHLLLNGQALRPLPLPGHWAGALTLHIALRNGAGLSLQARGLRLAQAPEGRFFESLAC